MPGHGSFAGIGTTWGHCSTAAVAVRAARKFRIVPVAIRMGSWYVFPHYQPCTVKRQAVQARARSRVDRGLKTHQTWAATL